MSNETAIINASALAAYVNEINEECPVPAGDPKPYVDMQVRPFRVFVKLLCIRKLDGGAVVMYLEKAQELGADKTYVERTGEICAEFSS